MEVTIKKKCSVCLTSIEKNNFKTFHHTNKIVGNCLQFLLASLAEYCWTINRRKNVTFCNKCFNRAYKITQLEQRRKQLEVKQTQIQQQLQDIRKEITDSSNAFSHSVLRRRITKNPGEHEKSTTSTISVDTPVNQIHTANNGSPFSTSNNQIIETEDGWGLPPTLYPIQDVQSVSGQGQDSDTIQMPLLDVQSVHEKDSVMQESMAEEHGVVNHDSTEHPVETEKVTHCREFSCDENQKDNLSVVGVGVTEENTKLLSSGVQTNEVNAEPVEVERVNNAPDGQNSPKEFIALDVSRIPPSLFSTDQPNKTKIDDVANPCEDNFIGMDAAVNDPQRILESEDAVDEESADSKDDINITRERDEELQAKTRPAVVLKKLKEANFSEQFDSKSFSQQPPLNASSLKHRLRNRALKKKVGQSSSSKIIHGQTGPVNAKKVKKSVSSLKVRGRVGTGKKQHKCQKCSKVFTRLSHLKQHTRVHTGERPFKCSFCVKCFSHSSTLHSHERTHTGERLVKCSFCAKTFTQFSNMQVHLRIHTGEKPFECSFCRKAFCQLSNLQCHLRMHIQEKPFKCAHCTKSFARLLDLRMHENIHAGEKPFQCSFCVKSFAQLSTLLRHLRIHTGEKPFKCFHCTKTFAHSCSLKCHVKKHHPGEKTS